MSWNNESDDVPPGVGPTAFAHDPAEHRPDAVGLGAVIPSLLVVAVVVAVVAAYSHRAELAKWVNAALYRNFLATLQRSISIGTIHVSLPGLGVTSVGAPVSAAGGLHCKLEIHDVNAIWRILVSNDIGFGTGYCDGLWTTDNLTALFAILVANREAGTFDDSGWAVAWVAGWAFYLAHLWRANTLSQSKENIERHYDLGNAMYEAFLDPTMTYSSALFKDGDLDLERAQLNKYDRIIAESQFGPADRVVEVGCGWGWFAIRAVQTTGCSVVGITLSKEQLAYAEAKVAELGLSHKIEFHLLDYRDAAQRFKGQFDRAVSIEMIEAVGVEYLPTYFNALRDLVKPSGSIMVQAISVVEAKYEGYCNSTDFIQQYIFPGGHCPSLAAVTSAAGGAGLTVHDVEEFGLHYAETLRQWDRKFVAAKPRLLELGYDENFVRMWHYYFCFCEAGFAARLLSLYQIRFTKHYAVGRPDRHVDNPVFGVARAGGAAMAAR